ncbi:DNA mismatch repair protein Msh6 [Myriangium duriaei CBS 260.36]|uniref:DNA mismatch repair protein n=1 Tax=Myriangium duriaei CBS 260.36 TaxID=1168546 RepID=A0A9P4IU05_9PEZI|nr:DNA mismatch repair protein Msh6 [Myriangium duriaei CBS 260.36]
MVRGIEGNEMSTPKQKPASAGPKPNQKSILGFFQKKTGPASSPVAAESNKTPKSSMPTPSPSIDALEASSPPLPAKSSQPGGLNKENEGPDASFSSPSRRAKKKVSYAESDDDDEEPFKPISMNASGRASKRRRISVKDDSDDDNFAPETDNGAGAISDEDMDDFIVPDEMDEDEEPTRTKKRPSKAQPKTKSSPSPASSPPDHDLEIPSESTAQQWKFDPETSINGTIRPPPAKSGGGSSKKQKAHMTEPDKRYTWLANVLDADRNPPGHPDYDPRTIFVPSLAWDKFSPFEKQYWEIKQKFWDTIVFFKKGKFYELYENDATIGHQLFDLKLTDRVNMRMVGVPEASLDHWANQFVAKGFKIARVDQMESALAKDMRERDEKTASKKAKPVKEEKVIRRELAAVLTSGTLVDGGMLQDDMATFCAAIKESEVDGLPAFGIAFVDTATGQFHLANFVDDVDMTKFETFVAQTRPGELLLEKGYNSPRALRILKNNTPPTTIWNYLKSDKEFLSPQKALLKIEGEKYYESADSDDVNAWPVVLREAKEKENVFSAFGALVWYLHMLKIERDLLTLGNFQWYDPIRKATSLVLDGQSLINLEIFANSFDGSSEGTLFTMLNRCITPFGKRMLRQWVCHPLADAAKINARLDAVDGLNADQTVTNNFTSDLSKLPDLERLISRIHAGRCKAQDFVKVLEGFEQIEYTMSMLAKFGEGDGLIGQLISSMPDLQGTLKHWKDAFDRPKAKADGLLVPEPGVETDFDESEEHINNTLKQLDDLLKRCRKELGSTALKFTDNGKEIYQVEVPVKVKNVPKSWRQMSATKQVKRYYFPELEDLVQTLKEAQETHAQIVKQVAGRFYARFDEDYSVWLAAVKIIAHLDCLISLAKASSAMGHPSCRPTFVHSDRSQISFTDLRHPTMLTTVTDFIPNDITLGGSSPNIDLLTGANAAGKSTVLRMTCIAVILAQIGCYVPCSSATLTPVDRIMSRLGAHDNIFAGQSTFMVELSETKKILSEATPHSLVILDELGRGTSSYDGVAVAQAVLHHVATHVGCIGFFATHYHSLAAEFADHPEVEPKRMAIQVDDEERRVTFLYKLEQGVAEGSFGMHCAAMCGIPKKVIDRAEEAARSWEHTGRLQVKAESGKGEVGLGWLSDVAGLLREEGEEEVGLRGLEVLRRAVEVM